MSVLGFRPKQVTKKLISVLPDRAQDVVVKRFGLGDEPEGMTLEAIGTIYGITRERVRQIENHALGKVRESEAMKTHDDVFDELEAFIHELGGIISEEELLGHISPRRDVQNHVFLILTLGDRFVREKENTHMKHRWHVDRQLAEAVHNALDRLHKSLSPEDIISEREIINSFTKYLDESRTPAQHRNDEATLRRWLAISKSVDKNPLGEWGLATSPNIRLKGMRDYAYLVIRQHGSPMHFTEVTKKIKELFDKKAHVATTHNELIKDDRFVLVGRGLYALAEWGYMRGIVREVIEQILEKQGPLTKDEIIDRVLKERYVKPNTVVVNLQDSTFERTDDGRYTLA